VVGDPLAFLLRYITNSVLLYRGARNEIRSEIYALFPNWEEMRLLHVCRLLLEQNFRVFIAFYYIFPNKFVHKIKKYSARHLSKTAQGLDSFTVDKPSQRNRRLRRRHSVLITFASQSMCENVGTFYGNCIYLSDDAVCV